MNSLAHRCSYMWQKQLLKDFLVFCKPEVRYRFHDSLLLKFTMSPISRDDTVNLCLRSDWMIFTCPFLGLPSGSVPAGILYELLYTFPIFQNLLEILSISSTFTSLPQQMFCIFCFSNFPWKMHGLNLLRNYFCMMFLTLWLQIFFEVMAHLV